MEVVKAPNKTNVYLNPDFVVAFGVAEDGAAVWVDMLNGETYMVDSSLEEFRACISQAAEKLDGNIGTRVETDPQR